MVTKIKQQEMQSVAADDPVIVDQVLGGNRELFEVLVRRHNQRLFRIGMGYLRNTDQVEDAMQEAYVKAFLNLSRFRGVSTFATWLTRIMINECLMILRRERRALDVLADDRLAAFRIEADENHAAKNATLKEMKTLLEKTISELPELYRIVFMMREVQQLSTREVAECLGITPESVKVRLHRAREALKAALVSTAAGAELFSYGAERCDRVTGRVMKAIRAAA